MKSTLVLSAASIILTAAVVLTSCGPRPATPAPTSAPTPAPAPTPTPTPTPTPAPAPQVLVEKPQYGGTITVLRPNILDVFDGAAIPQAMVEPAFLVYDQFVDEDWAKGAAGSGAVDWGSGAFRFEDYTGELAESWEIPQIGTWILKIRKGVRWALNPASEASRLMNGREFTADDAVYSVRRYHTDPAFPNASVRRSQTKLAATTTIEKTGPWEVTLRTPFDPWNGFFWITWGGNSHHLIPREVVEKYGNANDWRNVVGTGPFMITDWVSGSGGTLIKNPNYWKTDPVGPGKGNQLPYVDAVKLLIVPDVSTRLAAMRTGRADQLNEVEWEDARSLMKTSPALKYHSYIPTAAPISFRIEEEKLPFKDKRVRQALMMATDFEAMKNDLYQGYAEIDVFPVTPAFTWLHVPMKELPGSVQALYKYNPERAKQLLAEAGYPNGFKTKMIVQNVSRDMDPAAVFKAMWAKIGVEVELQPREAAVKAAMQTARSWEEMNLGNLAGTSSIAAVMSLSAYRGVGATSYINDPVVEDIFQRMTKHHFTNMPEVDRLFREFVPYIMEQAYVIPRPSPYSYTFWQPWIKNYNGEGVVTVQIDLWLKHVWIDRDLKEKITGRR